MRCRLTSNKVLGYRGESESEKTTCQDVTRAPRPPAWPARVEPLREEITRPRNSEVKMLQLRKDVTANLSCKMCL